MSWRGKTRAQIENERNGIAELAYNMENAKIARKKKNAAKRERKARR